MSRAAFRLHPVRPAIEEATSGFANAPPAASLLSKIEAGLEGLPSASKHASALAIGGLKRLIEELGTRFHLSSRKVLCSA
jgi:hypothetical protein